MIARTVTGMVSRAVPRPVARNLKGTAAERPRPSVARKDRNSQRPGRSESPAGRAGSLRAGQYRDSSAQAAANPGAGARRRRDGPGHREARARPPQPPPPSGNPRKFRHGIYLVYTRYILLAFVILVYTRYMTGICFLEKKYLYTIECIYACNDYFQCIHFIVHWTGTFLVKVILS